jgi:endonuclease-3
MDALTRLPGVSRKTGNIVLSEAFGITEGIVVDTSVTRVAQRLHLSTQPHPKQIEQDLMDAVPERNWYEISHLLAFHGERLCHLRRPACARCSLSELCPSAEL